MDRARQFRRPISRRSLLAGASAALWTAPIGCVWEKFVRTIHPKPVPCVLSPTATKEVIVAHLNDNISRLTSWRSMRAKIGIQQTGTIPMPALNAQIAVESPSFFRLRVASALRGEEADFGSNNERFWFWVRESPQPVVMTAAHSDLAVAQQYLPFPFEPEWVMEAMGVILLNPDDFVLEPVSETRAKLISQSITPVGQQVQKVMAVDLCQGRIVEHSLNDVSGNLIARATLSDYRSGSAGISVPYTIVLEWPQAGSRLTLSFLDIELNPPYLPEQMWELPTTLGQVVDLGQLSPRPSFGR